MKCDVEMGSVTMMCIPSFIKICSIIQKLQGGDSQTHKQHGDLLSLLLLFQNTARRLIITGEFLDQLSDRFSSINIPQLFRCNQEQTSDFSRNT
jgi:hypothetical protein